MPSRQAVLGCRRKLIPFDTTGLPTASRRRFVMARQKSQPVDWERVSLRRRRRNVAAKFLRIHSQATPVRPVDDGRARLEIELRRIADLAENAMSAPPGGHFDRPDTVVALH